MKALITGADGFVGRYLMRHLLASGDEVVATGKEDPPSEVLEEFKGNQKLQWQTLDVTDAKRCFDVIHDVSPEVVFHLAGISFVPACEDDFELALRVNVSGTSNLIRACHLLANASVFVFISSSEVYGKIAPEDLPLSETTAVRPNNNYSLTKLMAEEVVLRYGRYDHVRPVLMRPFNHIGPGQDERFVCSSFARQLADIAVGAREPVLRVGNLSAKRDFSDVRDIVRAYRNAALTGSGLYNLSSGGSIEIQKILDTLIEASGQEVRIELDQARMRPSEVPELYGTAAKAKHDLGWTPEYSIDQTLKDIYADALKRASA